MNVIDPLDIERIAAAKRPLVALVRLVAMKHPAHVRKRRVDYAEAAGMAVDELASLLDDIDKFDGISSHIKAWDAKWLNSGLSKTELWSVRDSSGLVKEHSDLWGKILSYERLKSSPVADNSNRLTVSLQEAKEMGLLNGEEYA